MIFFAIKLNSNDLMISFKFDWSRFSGSNFECYKNLKPILIIWISIVHLSSWIAFFSHLAYELCLWVNAYTPNIMKYLAQIMFTYSFWTAMVFLVVVFDAQPMLIHILLCYVHITQTVMVKFSQFLITGF